MDTGHPKLCFLQRNSQHTQTTPQNQTVPHTQTIPQNQTVPHTQTTSQNQTVPQNATTTAAHATATHSEDTVATSTSLNAFSKSVYLLKTAIANVSAGETTVEGHILFDEGAQRSFITQELTNQLQLWPTHHENIRSHPLVNKCQPPEDYLSQLCLSRH